MRVVFLLAILFSVVISSGVVHAGVPGGIPPSCDSNFMDVLKVHSWMAGQRDLEAAETLILQPESILEYSCFMQRVGETKYNGRFAVDDRTTSLADLTTPIAGGLGVGCNTMNIVWEAARCLNFENANFLTFEDITGLANRNIEPNDLRVTPAVCAGVFKADRDANWAVALPAAFPVPNLPANPGGIDRADTHLNLLDPTDCGGDVLAVPTGLIVLPVSGAPYPDAACSAPSCYYNGAAGGCQ